MSRTFTVFAALALASPSLAADRFFTVKVPATGAASITEVVAPAPPPIQPGYTARAAPFACNGLDVTAAAQSWLDSLPSYSYATLPAGTCVISRHLLLANKTNVIITGAGKDLTILSAKDPTQSAFTIYQANGVTAQDFQVYSPNTTARLDAGDARGIYVTNSTGVVLNRVKVRNIAAAGVAFWNVTNSKILNSEAENTRADSFHVTGNSNNILVQFNIARGAGDDSFSSIGYGGEDLHDIAILDNQSYDGAWGSGVSFEGTRNGKAQRNKVYRSGAAGLRVASFSAYASALTDGIDLSDNYLEGCVTRAELVDAHGAILIYTDNNAIHNVAVSRNTVKDTKSHYGLLVKGLSATMNVTGSATGNAFLGVLQSPVSVWNYAVVSRSGNTLNGVAIP